ncbi:MAG: hypothetical protein ACUVQX_06855 [Candidatus Bathycorpusculaceae bacterium]
MKDAEASAPKQERLLAVNNPYSKVFTTEPKTRRHLADLMPTRKRAVLIMELLFQNNFIKEAPYETIHCFITEKADFIGLDERTITRYIGRPRQTLRQSDNPKTSLKITYPKTGTSIVKEYSAVKTLPEKLGVCQKLGYMQFDYRNEVAFLVLNHKNVPLPYHVKEAHFDSEKSEALERSKEDLCVSPIGLVNKSREADIETVVIERRERRDSKQHTQICSKDLWTSLALSPTERPVLKAFKEGSRRQKREELEI